MSLLGTLCLQMLCAFQCRLSFPRILPTSLCFPQQIFAWCLASNRRRRRFIKPCRKIGKRRVRFKRRRRLSFALSDSFQLKCFSRVRSEGFSFNSGGLGVEPCSRPVVSKFATVRNRSQPSATVRNRPQPFATVRNRPQPSATVRNRSQPSATVRNRPQPFATVRSRTLRRCHWGKLLERVSDENVTCQIRVK